MRKYPLTKAESCGRNPFLSRSVTELPKMSGEIGNVVRVFYSGPSFISTATDSLTVTPSVTLNEMMSS